MMFHLAARLFLSTLSLRRATVLLMDRWLAGLFLSTLSLRRATRDIAHRKRQKNISIHALLAESDAHTWRKVNPNPNFYPRSPCGERPILFAKRTGIIIFLSTLSLRRATLAPEQNTTEQTNFYPRSPCGERQLCKQSRKLSTQISIHALLAESDSGNKKAPARVSISIHALLAESDRSGAGCLICLLHFYPRSPCGERQQKCTKQWGTFCAYETNFIGIASSC